MQATHCAALLAAVAAVQVQMVLAQLSKKTVSWFAAGACYGPEGEGVVVWVTRGAVTSRREVEHRAPIGQTPPNVAKVVVDPAIFDQSVAVCGELGVPHQLRKLVLKEYRSPADRYSKLRGQFEQACQSFKKAGLSIHGSFETNQNSGLLHGDMCDPFREIEIRLEKRVLAPFHVCLAHWQIRFRYAIAHHPCTDALYSSGIEPTNTERKHM